MTPERGRRSRLKIALQRRHLVGLCNEVSFLRRRGREWVRRTREWVRDCIHMLHMQPRKARVRHHATAQDLPAVAVSYGALQCSRWHCSPGKQTEVVTLSAGGNRRALWPSALRGWPRAAHHEGKVAYRLCLRLRWRGRAPFLRDGVPHLAGVARRLGHCQDWRNGAMIC